MSQFATVTELYSSFDGGDGSAPRRVRGFLIDAPSFIAELDSTTDPGAFPRVGAQDPVNPQLVCQSREFRATGDGQKSFAECFYARPGEVWPTQDNKAAGYKSDSGLTRIGVIRQPQVFERLTAIGAPFGGGDQFEYESTWIEYIIPEQVFEVTINIADWDLNMLSVVAGQTGKIHTFGTAPSNKWLFQGASYNRVRATSDADHIVAVNYRWIGRAPIAAKPQDITLNGIYLPIPELPPFDEYRVAGAAQAGALTEPEIITAPVYDPGDAQLLPGDPLGLVPPMP